MPGVVIIIVIITDIGGIVTIILIVMMMTIMTVLMIVRWEWRAGSEWLGSGGRRSLMVIFYAAALLWCRPHRAHISAIVHLSAFSFVLFNLSFYSRN